MVSRTVICAALGLPPRSQSLTAGWAAAEAAYGSGDLPAVNEIELRIWVDGPSCDPGQVSREVRSKVAEMNIDVLRREEEAQAEPDDLDPPAHERLSDVSAPTLVITGDIDKQDVVDYTTRLALEIPDARLEIVAGTAHMVNMEVPDLFNTLVVNFLTE